MAGEGGLTPSRTDNMVRRLEMACPGQLRGRRLEYGLTQLHLHSGHFLAVNGSTFIGTVHDDY